MSRRSQPKIPSQRKANERLRTRLDKYVGLIDDVFDTLNMEAARLALSAVQDDTKPFRWKDYPQTRDGIKKVQQAFVDELEVTITNAETTEWHNSNEAQSLIADGALKAYKAEVRGKRYEKYYQENEDALEAFKQRKGRGMRLSKKLWNLSETYKEWLEATISAGIERGMAATTLSKRLSRYLHDFPSIQRDYKELYGKAAAIVDCEYRSARLARTEINMAYRAAENERWRQMDFIVGYEVKTTQSGRHEEDICDTLAGKYPVDFEFVGWHPNCMCYKIPIMKTDEEFWEGGGKSVNAVDDVPIEFTDWVESNREYIKSTKSTPYFIRDNKDVIEDILGEKIKIRYGNG